MLGCFARLWPYSGDRGGSCRRICLAGKSNDGGSSFKLYHVVESPFLFLFHRPIRWHGGSLRVFEYDTLSCPTILEPFHFPSLNSSPTYFIFFLFFPNFVGDGLIPFLLPLPRGARKVIALHNSYYKTCMAKVPHGGRRAGKEKKTLLHSAIIPVVLVD
nr:hypothetical protein HOY82DRAFT_272373 [Tuber indicum]